MDIRLKFAGFCQDCDIWQEVAGSSRGRCGYCLTYSGDCLCDLTCRKCREPLSDDEHIDDDINAVTILELSLPDIGVKILEHSFNGCYSYSLIWGDYVANEYRESFELLAVAMMRLAVLMACRQNSWVKGFATHGVGFDTDATKFIASQLT